MAEKSSPSSSQGSLSYHQYPGSSGSSDNDSNSTQEDSKQQPANIFRNDGSFMEMFKKMQQQGQVAIKKEEEDNKDPTEDIPSSASLKEAKDSQPSKEAPQYSSAKKPVLSLVGKRRGGRVLATGMVKKQRKEPVTEKVPEGGKTDAWSEYMNEVRKYREQSCEEEGKRRPLVK